jgi:uncharacterized lipoprotein YmbA
MSYFPISIFAILAVSACSTFKPVKDASTHHLLEPLVPERILNKALPAIAIKRPSIPGYLDRLQLVTRKDGQLMMSPLHLWAESLDVGISRVMAMNLSRLTGSMNIHPVESFIALDYTQLLELRITQFEPDTRNQMILEGIWKVQPVDGEETRSHFFRLIMAPPISERTMSERVAAMNQELDSLARQIASEL